MGHWSSRARCQRHSPARHCESILICDHRILDVGYEAGITHLLSILRAGALEAANARLDALEAEIAVLIIESHSRT